jgi:hypothetical protein
VTRRRSRTEGEIPLHILPVVLTRTIREWGDGLYRISVKRTHWHHFNVTVRTRPIPKELKPVESMEITPDTRAGTGKRSRVGRGKCPA